MKCGKCGRKHDGSFGSGRFCSRSCANSRIQTEEIRKRKSITLGGTGNILKRKRKCRHCNKDLIKKQKKYCSHDCQFNFQYEDWIRKSEDAGKFIGFHENRTGDSTSRVKRYLILKYGYKCVICNTKEWRGKPVPLVLDHIDGKADNWEIRNLRMICQNCNAQTSTFSGRNKGNGVRKRKKYIIGTGS